MALSERSRSTIYQTFTTLIDDEEAVEEMLSYFPARDVEEPVTKELLRAEMAALRSELRGEMSSLRVEMAEMELRLKVELRDAMRQQTQWMIGVMITLVALMVSIQAFIR